MNYLYNYNNHKNHLTSDNIAKLSKRVHSSGSTFITHTEHTTIFNTVHILAAVIGIVGAFLVGIAIFIACRKKRRKKKDIENNGSSEMAQVEQLPSGVNNDLSRFSQFANDFETSQTELIKQPKSVFLPEEEDISPLMQQHRLQLKLLQQKLCISQLNNASCSAAEAPLTPPPPYCP
ncbi:hypothetical protein K501DRAFT_336285 [Backusella circina FSU 941]|nr:hypothetical protein K501DRAFT_336285 [Backusella circina FSU 941]